MHLKGKVAVVTGGSRGIGKEIALRLGAAGAYVYVNYRSRSDAAEATVAEIMAAGGQARAVPFNVADTAGVEAAFAAILAEAGRLDILVNNAGITRDGLLMKMKEADWDDVLAINLKGAFLCMKAVCRPMMKQRSGRIITITSVIGFAGNAGQANYAAAKAGLMGLTRSMARELASRGITVNAVAPGYIDTDMTRDLDETVKEKIRAEIPMGTLGTPADVAGAVMFLVSDDARYVTGQGLHVNGGMYM
ncbi:MAG: 3-oxoacyl-[acyl-carrier-protein] reductase [Deltaproteobacteria bacterium CG_4_10_14_3_um_filter_60_8]|nr:MAG: 3-oxoacyl-[acyl-carrier-protein] reductase [Desulfobacterales bacterium CG2_30_60_27]PIP44551.1 MAG: 3-oxoacyl-[acyl-carrier-protein] reductase [Deltaproteobacteria bacterium CG23_combo_of_CG06-09_8_20_14_all_60_8]PIY21544.1 MAG: 3-oxoacyl-[acyl-carrier-protein] reductase [Deltaproteobacteria bacterium CG_4_10_14_3_um_filter_60_8]